MNIFGLITNSRENNYCLETIRTFLQNTNLNPEDLFYVIDNDCEFELPESLNFANLRIIRNTYPKSKVCNWNKIVDFALNNKANAIFLGNKLIFTPGWFEKISRIPNAIVSPVSNREIQYSADNLRLGKRLSMKAYLHYRSCLPFLLREQHKLFSGIEPILAFPFFSAFIPNQILAEVGYFDEQYGNSPGADLDYCLRTSLRDYKICYALEAMILQLSEVNTLPKLETNSTKSDTNALLFENKWGKALTKIVIDQKIDSFLKAQNLMPAFKQKRFGEIISYLRE